MFGTGKRLAAHVFGIRADGLLDGGADLAKLFDELGYPARKPEHIFHDEDLPIARHRRTDADGRHGQCGGDARCKRPGDSLKHDGKCTSFGNETRIFFDSGPLARCRPLCLETAQDFDGLRRQSDMGHDRNTAVDKKPDGFGHALAALDFDGAAVSFLHDARRITEGDRWAFLIRAERHIDDDQGLPRAAHHGAPMHDHQVERHRQRRLEAMHHHAQAVADQKHVAIGIGNGGRMGVIRGQCHNRPDAFHGLHVGSHQAFLGGVDGHGLLELLSDELLWRQRAARGPQNDRCGARQRG